MKKYFLALAAIFFVLASFAQVNLLNGLVAHYTLDGHAVDSSSNGLNGFIHGPGSITNRYGKPNKALSFNGSSDYISIPHNSAFNLTASRSFSMWYRVDNSTLVNYPNLIFKQGDQSTGSYPHFAFQLTEEAGYGANRYKIVYFNGKNSTNFISYSKEKYINFANQWVHIVGTYNLSDGYMRLYFNNKITDSVYSPNFAPNTSTDSVQIGRGNKFNYSASYFKGHMDDIRIYSRTLNLAEIDALYKEVFYYRNTLNYTICQGDSIQLRGKYRKNAGIYIDTVTVSNNYDSIITSIVAMNPSYTTPRNITICQGTGFFAGGKFQTTAGLYFDTLKTTKNCDSIIATTLIVNQIYNTPRTMQICKGNSILLGGRLQTLAGIYYDSLKTTKGCDSIIISTLIVNPVYVLSQSLSICQGDSIKIGTKYRSQAGTYIDSLVSAKGCDSVVFISLFVNPKYHIITNAGLCPKSYVLINGKYYTKAGTYIDTFKTKFGCDSLIQVNINQTTVNTNVTQNSNVLIASATGASYRWLDCNNSYFPLSGQTQQSFIAQKNGNYSVAVTQNLCTDTSICFAVVGLDIYKVSQNEAKIYPNPANEIVTVDFGKSTLEAEITIYTVTGKKIFFEKFSNVDKASLDINNISEGVYLLEVNTDETKSLQKLFIR